MEKGGVLLFDMNTPYKHQNVLGENVFTFEEEDASCVWRNHYSAADRRVEIGVDIDYRETGSTSTSSSTSTPTTSTPSAPRWKSMALRWKVSATARALAL